MAKICFDFTGEKFWFDEADLLGLLKNIEAKPKLVKLSHKNDLWNIINTPENKKKYYGSYFCFLDDEKYLKAKELLFFYHVRDLSRFLNGIRAARLFVAQNFFLEYGNLFFQNPVLF